MKQERDLNKVLTEDGIKNIDINKFQNLSINSLSKIIKKMGNPRWAVRVIFNEVFGAVLIAQNPLEGNRLHYHPDSDECWIILKGNWEWYIEGEGTKKIKKNDIVLVKKGKKHHIKVVGNTYGIRLAITKPNINHVFV